MGAFEQDPVVQFVTSAARQRPGAVGVFLFGSRAHGTAQRTSDYDFAIDTASAPVSDRDWAGFSAFLDDAAPTLNRLDIINLSAPIDLQFREEIQRTAMRVDNLP